jgi:pyochelin biosynthetic protein PchC
LPHAGGGAGSFREWPALLPPSVELFAVQYPGREDRFGDPLIDNMDELVRQLVDALVPVLDRPYVLFGHSMGAAVAYETVQALRRRGVAEPAWLFVSSREPPDESEAGDVHLRDDDGLVQKLLEMGGTSEEVLADPGLRGILLSYVRSDFRLVETYRPRPAPPLTCPVVGFFADQEDDLSEQRLAGWSRATTGRTEVRRFTGDHFYLVPHRRAVVAEIVRRLDPAFTRTGIRTGTGAG